ncbi:MAG TPA: response regulator [Bryobacteraceae bacterium]|jgi:chemotaxis family two-component system response regulator Rcp1|nr:response regulator [Bryobacteraceae bacterium]
MKDDLKQRHILLIEDNEADAMITKMVHEEVKHCSWLDVVYSGAEAIRYLRGEGKYAGRQRPDIILMDMTLPAQSGLDLLKEIRSLPGCENLPVAMVSGSDNPRDIRRAYELGANCVIKKGSTWEEYFRKLETCYKFWCVVAELPPERSEAAH